MISPSAIPTQNHGLPRYRRARQQNAAHNSAEVEPHGVFRLKSNAKGRANGQPPPRILRLQQTNHEVGDQHPPQVIKCRVLKFGALKQRQRRERNRQRRSGLGEPSAAKFSRHEPGNHHGERLRDYRKQTQSHQRESKDGKPHPLHKRRQRRIRYESPIKMPRIAQNLQLVSMKPVAPIREHMNQPDDRSNAQQRSRVTRKASINLPGVRLQCHFGILAIRPHWRQIPHSGPRRHQVAPASCRLSRGHLTLALGSTLGSTSPVLNFFLFSLRAFLSGGASYLPPGLMLSSL